MALGYLVLLYVLLLVATIVLQGFLYIGKERRKNGNLIYILNVIFGIVLSYMLFTSLPTNYIGQKILAVILGFVPIAGLVLKLRDEKYLILSKVLVSISIIASLVQIFV